MLFSMLKFLDNLHIYAYDLYNFRKLVLTHSQNDMGIMKALHVETFTFTA